jgi:hypothetical protein
LKRLAQVLFKMRGVDFFERGHGKYACGANAFILRDFAYRNILWRSLHIPVLPADATAPPDAR